MDRKTRERTLKMAILDKDKKEKKILYKKVDKSRMNMDKPMFKYQGGVHSHLDMNYIFICDSREDFSLKLYSHQGELVRELKIPYQKAQITDSYKEGYIKKMKTPRKGRVGAYFKEMMKKAVFEFPTYFVPFRRIYTDNERIYAYRDASDFSKHELWVISYEGKILNKLEMPNYAPFSFDKGILYYLQENEDEEEYELMSLVLYP